jgi:hypothetical protein
MLVSILILVLALLKFLTVIVGGEVEEPYHPFRSEAAKEAFL